METVRGAWEAGEALGETTGTYFDEQTSASVAEAMQRWEASMEGAFDPQAARKWAAQFATPLFLERYRAFVLSKVPAAAEVCAPTCDAAATVLH